MERCVFILLCCALITGCISEPYSDPTVFNGEVDLGGGKVDLPEGFTHKRDQGVDTLVGHFTSADGRLMIQYDIGDLAGVYATKKDGREVLSSSEVTVNDLKALIVVFRQNNTKYVVISFPKSYANFFAKVQSDVDIEAVRKLALSYR